ASGTVCDRNDATPVGLAVPRVVADIGMDQNVGFGCLRCNLLCSSRVFFSPFGGRSAWSLLNIGRNVDRDHYARSHAPRCTDRHRTRNIAIHIGLARNTHGLEPARARGRSAHRDADVASIEEYERGISYARSRCGKWDRQLLDRTALNVRIDEVLHRAACG